MQDGSNELLTRETSDLTGLDLWLPNRIAFQTSAETVLLCCFTYLHNSNLKLRFLQLLC